MVKLQQDPAHLPRPDFTSNEYAEARQGFTSTEITDRAVASILEQAWLANQKIESARWRRVREEEVAREAESLRQAVEEGTRKAAQEATDREEAIHTDKKKYPNKYTPIGMGPPLTHRPDIPSAYGQRKLKEGMYLEMWYLSREGLDAAKQAAGQLSEDALHPTLNAATGETSWMPASAKRDPHSFKRDEDLSWDEFSSAVPRMLVAMQHSSWPAE
ncbi:hypothetical protein M422DRAFT_252942 [Sphaerobolus stellatus SS14]|uniref:Uncharacterized protein n=1 Tax=Sphaerobolus stellatus (strain SS14) TaxID=990650 RepID=A0A0C9UKU1_SPHS4|nr:hypothetical protein M422DRAFT_252942 [Sphaerobolus stellatus SS14]